MNLLTLWSRDFTEWRKDILNSSLVQISYPTIKINFKGFNEAQKENTINGGRKGNWESHWLIKIKNLLGCVRF